MNFTPLVKQILGTATFTIIKNMIIEKNVKDEKSKQISKTAIDLGVAFFMPAQMRQYVNTDFLMIRGTLGIAKSALKLFGNTSKYVSYLEEETGEINLQGDDYVTIQDDDELLEDEMLSDSGVTIQQETTTNKSLI